MNKERMLRVADLIENAPKEQFHMGSWFGAYNLNKITADEADDWSSYWDSVGYGEDTLKEVLSSCLPNELSCGTTACIAGWALVDMKNNNIDFSYSRYAEVLGAEYLGLSRQEAKALFYCNKDSVWYDVATQYGFEFDPDFPETWNINPKHAVDVLRRIANGDIDLSKFHDSTCDCDECYLNYGSDDDFTSDDVF